MTVYQSNRVYRGFNIHGRCLICSQRAYAYWVDDRYHWVHERGSIDRYERLGYGYHAVVPGGRMRASLLSLPARLLTRSRVRGRGRREIR